MNIAESEPFDLVDETGACREIGGDESPVHRSTLWRGIRDGRYPPPLKMGPGINRWSRAELRAVRLKAAAARDGGVE